MNAWSTPALSLLFLSGIAALAVVRTVARHHERVKPVSRVAFLLILYLLALLVGILLPAGTLGPMKPYLQTAQLLFLSLAAIRLSVWIIFELALIRRRLEIPDIILDLSVVVLSAAAFVLIIRHTFNINLASVIATSAVVTIVLGLALQDTLANMFAGLALQMEKPFTIGEWISFDGQTGRIEEINWRTTTIRTLARDLVVIPNSLIAKSPLTNISRPTPLHGLTLSIDAPPDIPPNRVRDAVLQALEDCPDVAWTPLPEVRLLRYGETSLGYDIRFFITAYERHPAIQDGVMTRVWYHLRRAGVGHPYPLRELRMRSATPADEAESRSNREKRIASTLRGVDLLAPLSDSEIDALAARVRLYTVHRDEILLRQGEPGDSCFILQTGRAEVSVATPDGERVVGSLTPGQIFGEMSLMTGDDRTATVCALTDAEVIQIDKEHFAHILSANPEIAGRMSAVLARRHLELEQKIREGTGSLHPDALDRHASHLLARILEFFGL